MSIVTLTYLDKCFTSFYSQIKNKNILQKISAVKVLQLAIEPDVSLSPSLLRIV